MKSGGFLGRLRREPAVEPNERRRCVRTATVYQIAKLCTLRGEELCLLRDVSPTGLKAEVYGDMETGDRITIQLKTEHQIKGRVAWVERPMIGVRFDVEVPVLAMLAHCAFDDRLARMRPPRIDVVLPAILEIAGEEQPITVLNISLAGVRIGVEGLPPGETRCVLALPGLDRRGGTLRWARGGEAGVQLDEVIDFATFAAWRRSVLDAAPAATVAA